ncbi:hypothetical protein F5879DRAFT_923726 [Lentinula edodes]|nr:hypothetical protein F5879DRAFT_923726 [Lentinula edodes]
MQSCVDLSLILRQYYDQPLPEIIHLEEHSFIQTAVSELFTACTLFAWVSAQNCALIYNHALSSYGREEVSESKFMLTSMQVWRAFVLVSLLKNWRERGRQLTMQNHGDLNDRLKEIMISMCSCDGWCHHWASMLQGPQLHSTSSKQPSSVVSNTHGPTTHLVLVIGPVPSTSLSSFSPLESLEFELDVDSDEQDLMHKSDKGNRPSKAFFAHRRTHNAQLVVCACGIISARATMFGAEAISGVKDFLKSVYPNRNDLPDAQQDLFFRGTMLPVDVFNFKSKHKESNEFCQKHCNPLQWTELVGDNGEWVFNSSAAEQGNVWIGGYQAIVREMLPHNYNFFLDEMIKRRNEVLVAKLRRAGNAPYRIPPYPAVL